jgi:hypothetical protein
MGNIISDPHNLSVEDLTNLKFKPLKIYIGENNSDIIMDEIHGTIFEVGVSPITKLPVDVIFENRIGEYRKFSIFQIKKIEVL